MLGATPTKIDMSLRFWSDRRPLGPVADRLGFPVAHLHVKGEPMAGVGPLAGRPSIRHYMSMAGCKGTSAFDVRDWIQMVAKAVRAQSTIVDDLLDETLEGVLWIAFLRGDPSSRPRIPDATVAAVASLGLSILLEDYTAESAAAPTKTWLPARHSLHSLKA